MTATLKDFAERRVRAADQLDALAAVVDRLGAAASDEADTVRSAAERVRSGRFLVLLLGAFSSGKSTLLNALIGEPVLPVKVNPCTAILTELVYADTPTVDVRYHDGAVRTLTPAAFHDEFQLRTGTETAGSERADRFGDVERAVVGWPLPLLADGVAVLDTPGLDDDEQRTERTLDALPHADAVILVLNATRFLSELERRTLRRHLLPLGLTNLFFPTTMVDLLDAITDAPDRELAAIHARATQVLGPLCRPDGRDRLAERFFLVNARGALKARFDGARRDPSDADALLASGMPAFEVALASFLVHERGVAQLQLVAAVARRVHEDLSRRARLDRAAAEASVEELRARQADLEPRLAELAAIAARVERTVDRFVERQQTKVWQDLRAFLQETERALPEAIGTFDLGALRSLDLLAPKGRDRAAARLRDEIEQWLAEQVAGWQGRLRGKLEAAVLDLRVELAGHAAEIEALSEAILTDFAGGLVQIPELGARTAVDPVERWFSVAMGAVLLSPGTMAAGWVDGYEGALKGAAGRLAARVAVVAIGALLGPVGWAGLALYAVTDAVLLLVTGGGQLRRLRDQLGRDLDGRLVAQAEAARPEVAARVAGALQPLRDGIVGAARAEADALREALDRTIASREAVAEGAVAREAAWGAALEEASAAVAALTALCDVDTPLR